MIKTDLFDFAWWGTSTANFDDYINELKIKAIPESWGSENKILKNYLNFTFKYLAEHQNNNPELNYISLSFDKSAASFNTGLFDEDYNPIYAFFKKNRNESPEWFFIGFKIDSDIEMNAFDKLPKRINYFIRPEELVFNPNSEIRINVPHILKDERNRERLPSNFSDRTDQELKFMLEGAVNIAKKRIAANYTIAVPQYYQGRLQLLIPLDLDGDGQAELALAIRYENGIYSGRTALTMQMAYNNARLITKPESSWVLPIS
jgi:hypothetical protein